MMKKMVKITSVLMFSIILLCSCNNDSEEDSQGKYNIYFINKDYTGLVSMEYTPESTDTYNLVKELIDKMYSDNLDNEYNKSKPDEVNMINYTVNINDNIVHIYFDSAYNEMDNITELMCRASIVLTLTQIPDVEYVNIYVDDQPLLDAESKPIGSMKANDFISLYEDSLSINQTITTVLYYANEDGDKLIPYSYTGAYEKNESLEEFIIKNLMKDIKGKGLYRTIPEDVELINVATKDGICYVNFSDSFLVESLDISDNVAIYSIVNSLFETNYITKVQITVNGEKDKMYHESISLNEMFVRNLDIVESETE